MEIKVVLFFLFTVLAYYIYYVYITVYECNGLLL